MASLLLRRSGVSVGLVAEVLNWRADLMIQVGVGHYHEEVKVLQSEWPGLRFIGFEPHPGIYRDLKDTYPGRIFPIAITDREGTMMLNTKRRHADGSSLIDFQDGQETTPIEVNTTLLDYVFYDIQDSHNDQRILLWLDCEGCELMALRGATRALQKVSMINIEMTANPPSKEWGSPLEIHRWLADRGWFIQWIHTQRITLGQCDYVYVKKDLFDPSYCCVPNEIERFQCVQ